MFKCKCCPEKDKRIEDLKEQITHLKMLISPPKQVEQYTIQSSPSENLMNGDGDAFDFNAITPQKQEEIKMIESEAQAIMSGTY